VFIACAPYCLPVHSHPPPPPPFPRPRQHARKVVGVAILLFLFFERRIYLACCRVVSSSGDPLSRERTEGSEAWGLVVISQDRRGIIRDPVGRRESRASLWPVLLSLSLVYCTDMSRAPRSARAPSTVYMTVGALEGERYPPARGGIARMWAVMQSSHKVASHS
jgi:hypothetical protein